MDHDLEMQLIYEDPLRRDPHISIRALCLNDDIRLYDFIRQKMITFSDICQVTEFEGLCGVGGLPSGTFPGGGWGMLNTYIGGGYR
jgi:hypothetical protein